MAEFINELTAMNVHVRFRNNYRMPATPANVRYLIRDVSNDREVKPWTSISPADEIDIQVSADDNALLDTRRNRLLEERVLTLQVNVGLDSQASDELRYWVRNLRGVV